MTFDEDGQGISGRLLSVRGDGDRKHEAFTLLSFVRSALSAKQDSIASISAKSAKLNLLCLIKEYQYASYSPLNISNLILGTTDQKALIAWASSTKFFDSYLYANATHGVISQFGSCYTFTLFFLPTYYTTIRARRAP